LHFLRGLRLVGCVCLLWDLEFGWDKLLRCSIDLHHCVGYLIGGCEFHSFCVAVAENLQVPLQREYIGRTWHFEYQVHVVGYRHELGDSWPTEDGMVGSLEVRDLELDVLGAVVLPGFPKVTGRTTEPSGIAAFPGTMP
jgi:hypothetical protein